MVMYLAMLMLISYVLLSVGSGPLFAVTQPAE